MLGGEAEGRRAAVEGKGVRRSVRRVDQFGGQALAIDIRHRLNSALGVGLLERDRGGMYRDSMPDVFLKEPADILISARLGAGLKEKAMGKLNAECAENAESGRPAAGSASGAANL